MLLRIIMYQSSGRKSASIGPLQFLYTFTLKTIIYCTTRIQRKYNIMMVSGFCFSLLMK